ncbi:MAG: hypothetical protein KDA89_12660, partial [Planctomycetaceae bacterium]|nr:hypothetical protein [Planctomycetaceae bacterium]
FGVTCYHMFAGQPPFPGKNSVSIAVQHLKEEAKPLSGYRRDLPEELCRIIHRMMSKRPEDRFQTPEELETVLKAVDGAAINPVQPGLSIVPPWLKRCLPPLRHVAAGLLICGVAGVVAGRQQSGSPTVTIKPAAFPKETSAARQFARAMGQHQNEAAWKAVSEYFPLSDEAHWARLQLAVYYLTKPRPDLNRADQAFSDVITAAAQKKVEMADLLFLGYLGRAYVAEEQHREQDRNDLVNKRLLTEFEQQLSQDQLSAPVILQEYCDRLRLELELNRRGPQPER